MNILILGGTGAIGASLIKILRNDPEKNVLVTSRTPRISQGNITYVQGDAHDLGFIRKILSQRYTAIIDFMAYGTNEFAERAEQFLDATDQYFFLSSSRVYADTRSKLTELSPRLLDSCKDELYLQTDEYALAKARQENILTNAKRKNWTIIRPYKTYNDYRFQLGVLEKEEWLYRVFCKKPIVFPADMASKKTSLTCADDAAKGIYELIGKEAALGESFHITNDQTATWNDILMIYSDAIEKAMGIRPQIHFIDSSDKLFDVWNPYQIRYDCLYDREFDNQKISSVCPDMAYKDVSTGLSECISRFVEDPKFRSISWSYMFWCDEILHEKTKLKDVYGMKEKLRYLKYKYF